MPPVSSTIKARAESGSGKNFTIAFSVIAFIVVAGCIVWGYAVPKWRQKYPPPPSPTRFNGLGPSRYHEVGSGTCQMFPSHPAILRGFTKQPSRELRQYDPRTETPFTKGPSAGDTISLPSIVVDRAPSMDLWDQNDSHGLFSPIKDPAARVPRGYPYSVPRTPGTLSEPAGYSTSVREFHDAKDYTLAVPEPLVLKARPAGRAPSLKKQLDRFPIPNSTSMDRKNLAHPNKLFAELEEAKHQQSKSGNRTEYPTSDTDATSDAFSPEPSIFEAQKYRDSRTQMNFIDKISITSAKADIQSTTAGGTKISMAKRGYWSSVADKHHQSNGDLGRNGTVTRPKTPVAEIRDMYDRGAFDFRPRPSWNAPLRRDFTPSTEPLTASGSAGSEMFASSTPPTSPQRRSSNKLPLLPTPLKPRRGHLCASDDTPTPDPAQLRGVTPSSAALPESPEKLAPPRRIQRRKRQQRRSVGFYHTHNSRKGVATESGRSSPFKSALQPRRMRSPNLNLTTSFRVHSPFQHNKSHSMSFVGSTLPPLATKQVPRLSFQTSSIYSRDTKGASLIRTPITPSFPTEVAIKEEGIQEEEEPKRANSIDLVRSKIDEWDLHTDDLNINGSPSTILKRTLSDQGPRSPRLALRRYSFHLPEIDFGSAHSTSLDVSIPKICIGRTSDDIFHDDVAQTYRVGNVLKKIIDVEMSGSESKLSSMLGRTAPGGAEWI